MLKFRIASYFIFSIIISIFALNTCSSPQKTEEKTTPNEEVKSRSIKKDGSSGCTEGDCNNGKGTYVWEDGSRYIGEWKEGLRSGKGVYIWASGDKYTGQFLNGDCNGDGVYLWANNAGYEGSWLNGKKHGAGKYTWPNGQVYEGEFKDDKIVTDKAKDTQKN